MTLTIPEARPHTDAVIACLDAAGITTGNATGQGLTPPYVVVYGDQGGLDGPMGDRYADIEQTLILHGIGIGPEQAQWVADKARAALLGGAGVNVPRRTVLYLDLDSSQPVQRDDDVQPPLFYAVDIYRLATTPEGTP